MIILCIVGIATALLVGIVIGWVIQDNNKVELEVRMNDNHCSWSQALEESTKDWKRILEKTGADHDAIIVRYQKIIDAYIAVIEDWEKIVKTNDETIRTSLETIRLNKETIKGYVDLVDRLKERIKMLEVEIDCEGEEWKPKNKKKNHPEDDPDFRV